MRIISGPWRNQFEEFIGKTRRHLVLASPFIKLDEVERLSRLVAETTSIDSVSVTVLTDFRVESIVSSSLDVEALRLVTSRFPNSSVVSLPRLHAKVYVSDELRAVITSANLTRPGIDGNIEYGVEIDEPEVVRQVSADMRSYARLGSAVSREALDRLVEVEQQIRATYDDLLRSARADSRRRFNAVYRAASREFIATQVGTRSSTAVFSEAILYLLARGALSTVELHPRVQRLLPDLCDDSVELIINGERFGKKWKHQVRNAQQALKRSGLIRFSGKHWSAIPA